MLAVLATNVILVAGSGLLSKPLVAMLSGAALGGILSAGLAITKLIVRRLWAHVGFVVLMGFLPGAIIGAISLLVMAQMEVDRARIYGLIGWLIALSLIALVGGLAPTFGAKVKEGRFRVASPAILSGSISAVPVAYLLSFHGQQPLIFTLSLAMWAAFNALVLVWLPMLRANRWMRVISGHGEDHIFPLSRRRVTIGTLADNDVTLPRFAEVFPVHCYLEWEKDKFSIIDDEQGGTVQVNYRHVREHTLKNGDLIKIGAALLQYGESR